MVPENWTSALIPADILRFIAVIIAFIAVSFGSLVTYINADVIFSLSIGFGYICFPTVLLDFQVKGENDKMHVLLVQLYGIIIIGSTLQWIFNRKNNSSEVWSVFVITRFLSLSTLAAVMLISRNGYVDTTPGWTLQHLIFECLAAICWATGHLRHAAISGKFNSFFGYSGTCKLNIHLLIDSILLGFLIFLTWDGSKFLVWSKLSEKADFVHLNFVKRIGTFLVGLLLSNLGALNLNDGSLKKNILLTRILISLAIISLVGFDYVLNKTFHIEAIYHVYGFGALVIANGIISQI